MTSNRLEAFTDGVIAILITIMVLEFKVPKEHTWAALQPMIPTALAYLLSFIVIGIYWNNHHNMLHAVKHVNGGALWANLALLFWLSLVPFATAWLGESNFDARPVMLYAIIQFCAGLSYYILSRLLVRANGPECPIAKALEKDWKGKASLGLYGLAVAVALPFPWVACGIFVAVAIMWFVPDRRFQAHMR